MWSLYVYKLYMYVYIRLMSEKTTVVTPRLVNKLITNECNKKRQTDNVYAPLKSFVIFKC